MEILVVTIIVLICLNIAAFFFLYKKVQLIHNKYNTLINDTKDRNLIEIVEESLKKLNENNNDIKSIVNEIESIKIKSRLPLQKYFVKRFNPFNETGGDHSFVIVLLNEENNGIIINSLHSRDLTRVYSKEVKNGKSEYKLSKEEEEALEQTKSKNSN